MSFCLIKPLAEKLKAAIKSGEIDPEKMNDMTSEEVHALLAKHIGDDAAREVNKLYESKLLLKNQEAGIVKMFRDVTGLSKEDRAELETKTKARYAERQRRIYNPADDEKMLNELTSDIYSKKDKTEVSPEQAQNRLSSPVQS